MIVAAGAADRQPEEGRADAVDHLGEDFLRSDRRIDVAADLVRSGPQR